jgi:hypothetical protein
MKKTLSLFEKYLRLFNEQDPANPQEGADQSSPDQGAAQPEAPAPAPEPSSELDENEKYVIKILTNAFIFNPKLFDRNKQQYIFNSIERLRNTVNVPVAKVIDDVKRIINLDNSLRVESKTVSTIKNVYMFLEQPADATEPQAGGGQAAEQPATEGNQKTSPSAGLNLTEIFPLYKELILKSLSHTPSEEELMILKPVVREFGESDPEKIVDTIQNILSQSLEDKEVQDTLSNA